MRPEQHSSGFTLLEIIVAMTLLSILAGAAAPYAVQQVRGARVRLTQERMRAVVQAMTGDPSASYYGYVADFGELPPTLTDLNQINGKPVYVVDAVDAIGSGYNGPYVANPTPTSLDDAWGTPLRYVAGIAQVSSAGADRDFGTADDLVFPDSAAGTSGSLTVNLTGIPNDGGVACLLGEDDADVFVAFSQSGIRMERQLTGVIGAPGPFIDGSLHSGLHGLRVLGQANWAGATTRDVVEVYRGAVQRRVALTQPVGPPAGCGP